MSAKIIQFPKSRTRSDEWHYFKTYYPLYLLTVFMWSVSIFTFMSEWRFSNLGYQFGAGLGIWLMGMLLLAEFTYILGVKRDQRLKKFQQQKESGKWIPPIYWLVGRVGTYMIYVVTVTLGAVATIFFQMVICKEPF